MDILNTVSLESNSQIKINFDGGDLSSDAGLLLFKEFLFKTGAVKLVNRMFKTNDTAWVEYGEFLYQAGSWSHPRRVVFKIEKPYGQMIHLYTFIVTTLEMEPYQVIQFYCGRGKMENFIKEGKSGFDFASVSSSSKLVNANRLLVHALAYNLFNWFRRLALAVSMRKQRIDTIRLKLLKIAARVVRSARYKYFKLCSSCPYKKEFYETLENIHNLKPQLE